MTTAEIEEYISQLHGVTSVDLWAKVAGKERLYIKTIKYNGGKTWNAGVGYTTLYVDLATMTLAVGGCAGAATRDALAKTLAAIRAMLARGAVHDQAL